MKNLGKEILYCFIGGILFYIADIIFSAQAYIGDTGILSDVVKSSFSLLTGVIIVIVILLYKNPKLIHMILRFIMLQVFYWCMVIIMGTSGLLLRIYDLYGIETYSLQDNLSGMLTFVFLLITIGIGNLMIIVKAVNEIVKYIVNRKKKIDN